MPTQHDDYMKLFSTFTGASVRPAGFLFWFVSQPLTDPEKIWSECPRGDWLVWMAEQLGCTPLMLAHAKRGIETIRQEERELPHTRMAEFVRECIRLRDCRALARLQ